VTDINRPLLGEPDAPCRSCGSPLAADQRYCLQCGTRRAEARLPFLDILARQVPAGAAAAGPPAPPPPRASWLARVSTNAAAVAGVACLLLALGVGVLIGGLGHDDSAAASPQVITVGGAALPATAAPTTAAPASTTAPATTGDGAAATKDTKKSSKASSSKQDAASSKDSKATNSAVKSLDSTSGGDYAKKSEKLPKTLGTGGKAPPKDTSGTAIGGGSDTESIG
jgi:hypothetical protein